LMDPFEATVQSLFAVAPLMTTVTSPNQTVEIAASSPLFPKAPFFITEICHFKTTNGAPTGGWPSYLSADDYIEITGLPNSDMGGITLEQWSISALLSTYTFSNGTVLGPNGTAIIAVGQLGSSSPSPSDFYYHGNGSYTSSFGSSTSTGRILKNANGDIIDAVGYGSYTFPAGANVTSADWSGNTPSGSSSSGNRLEGTYDKTATNWINSSVSPQNPNALNANVTLPSPVGLSGFEWTLTGTVVDTATTTDVGPYTSNGTYTYIATFNSGCGNFTDSVTVEVNLTTAEITAADVTCFGTSDGEATASSSGGDAPFTYEWSHGPTTATATGLSAGTYVVTVWDSNQWPSNDTIIITEPTEITASITGTPEFCSTAPGTLTVDASGGMSGYSYTWSNGDTTAMAENLTAGNYSVTITDLNNCTVILSDTVLLDPVITQIAGIVDVKCYEGNNGSASVEVTGGTMPYSYEWSDSQTDSMATDLTAGVFTVTVTDANGCIETDTVTIAEPTELVTTSNETDASCYGEDNGTAEASAIGGTPPYNYTWDTGQTGVVATGLMAGNYVVTVTDINNCQSIENVSINEPAQLDTSITITNITLTATLDDEDATYQWINCDDNSDIPGATEQSFTPVENGSYAVTVTLDGCSETSFCQMISTVGIENISSDNAILNVYPNPNDGRFIISTDKEAEYTLVNSLGQVIQVIQVKAADNFKAEVTGISTGVYYIIGVEENNTPVYKKIMVTR
nr:T9SS type A sorting domain-containing protein [Bacteroidota bacterium]